jgi:nitroreductase
LAALASDGNKKKIVGAPVCAIMAMDVEFHEQLPWLFPHTDARSWFAGDDKLAARESHAFRNSTLQGAYLMLAARALGLDCGPMSGVDNAAVDADFFADQPHWKSNFICSIGYGDPASIFGRSPRPDFDTFNRIL